MKFGKTIICFFAVWVFALSSQARSLSAETLDQNPELIETANSLGLTDDWPNAEDAVLVKCLKDLKKKDAKKGKMSQYSRVQFLDQCSERWTTVGALKDQFSE